MSCFTIRFTGRGYPAISGFMSACWGEIITAKACATKEFVMASFDPRERRNEPEVIEKLPLRRFVPSLRKFLEVAMPTDLQRLKRHQVNMEKCVAAGSWKELHIEQINASRTVQQLNATMRELENTRSKIIETDHDEFDKRVGPIRQKAIEAVQSFGNLQYTLEAKVRSQVLQSEDNPIHESTRESIFSGGGEQHSSFEPNEYRESNQQSVQSQDVVLSDQQESMAAASWDQLRQSLLDLQGMITDFSTLVEEQQEKVDTISANVESAQHNVRTATIHLGQASKLKAAAVPLAGAIVGGILGGPIGLMAGFKLAGLATAVGGSFVGYQGARYMKRRHHDKVDRQLGQLSIEDSGTELQRLKSE